MASSLLQGFQSPLVGNSWSLLVQPALKLRQCEQALFYVSNRLPQLDLLFFIFSIQRSISNGLHLCEHFVIFLLQLPLFSDLNECGLKPRPCKHRCMNTYGSYKCYCLNGYMLMPDGSCSSMSRILIVLQVMWA